jgi:hypothetical protein
MQRKYRSRVASLVRSDVASGRRSRHVRESDPRPDVGQGGAIAQTPALIGLAYASFGGVKLVLGVDDLDGAGSAL